MKTDLGFDLESLLKIKDRVSMRFCILLVRVFWMWPCSNDIGNGTHVYYYLPGACDF
jgi:hypothetical protein